MTEGLIYPINNLPILDKEVNAIAEAEIPGINAAGKERIKQNILTTREAVKDGKHSTIFNPGSWKDILRALSAYDADHLIVAETADPVQGEAARQLDLLGVKYEATVSEDKKTTVINFEMEGRARTITERNEDARLVAKEIGNIDVLHIYNPTGANTPLNVLQLWALKKYNVPPHESMVERYRNDPDAPKPKPGTDEYEIVSSGIQKHLIEDLYNQVNEGGFFVFNESHLSINYSRASEHTPKSLYELIGIEEKQTISRHPSTIVTSGKDWDKKTGFIYKKERTVEWAVMEAAEDAIDLSDSIETGFVNLNKGGLDFLDVNLDMSKEDIEKAVQGRSAQLQGSLRSISDKFISLGSDAVLVQKYEQEVIDHFVKALSDFQRSVKELLQTYDSVAHRIQTEGMSMDDGIAELGIVVTGDKIQDTIYPFASALVYNDEKNRDEIYDFLTEFAKAELKLKVTTG
jgi:hypothetical protein